MEWNKTVYLMGIFGTMALVFTIITLLVAPYTPEQFDANNFYSVLFIGSIIIAGISLGLAIVCLRWWYSYQRR